MPERVRVPRCEQADIGPCAAQCGTPGAAESLSHGRDESPWLARLSKSSTGEPTRAESESASRSQQVLPQLGHRVLDLRQGLLGVLQPLLQLHHRALLHLLRLHLKRGHEGLAVYNRVALEDIEELLEVHLVQLRGLAERVALVLVAKHLVKLGPVDEAVCVHVNIVEQLPELEAPARVLCARLLFNDILPICLRGLDHVLADHGCQDRQHSP
mmetsp:Transcript_52443/g.149466  ORF Transcript_52443/g.149466 Transcript_52443/m.149466 type:complete len:213 (-) Transcript_52443:1541-2179(-)